jgi:dTDP-4-amino-4,6-dideoxygalactose transaminase
MEIADLHGLWVIEDAAHAHGAEYNHRRAGSWGHIGCFSFYPTKVMGAFGDGGAVTTSDPKLFDRLKVLRYMGQHVKYVNEVVGYQQRLDELQAAILRVKLRHLDSWIKARQNWARMYTQLLADTPVIPPQQVGDVRHVFYLYTIRAPERDALMKFLAQHGIGSAPVYPNLVPYQPAYQHLGIKPGDFPVADVHLAEILCLPMFPELTEQEVTYVADIIRKFYLGR